MRWFSGGVKHGFPVLVTAMHCHRHGQGELLARSPGPSVDNRNHERSLIKGEASPTVGLTLAKLSEHHEP